jgi:hypothetical protein
MSKNFNYKEVKTDFVAATSEDLKWIQRNQRQGLGFEPFAAGDIQLPAVYSYIVADNVILTEIITKGGFFTDKGDQKLQDKKIFRLADPLILFDTSVIKRLLIYSSYPKNILIKEYFSL